MNKTDANSVSNTIILKLIEANLFDKISASTDTSAEKRADQIIAVHKKLMDYFVSIE